MVEEILQWLKNISIFLIFMTTVLNLIPEKEDKKPVQFFLGIVMVLIFFQPVLKAGGLEQKMAQTLDRLTLEEEAAAMDRFVQKALKNSITWAPGKKRRSARSGCICQRAAFRGQPFR